MFAMQNEEITNYHRDGVIIPQIPLAEITVAEMREVLRCSVNLRLAANLPPGIRAVNTGQCVH